MKAKLRHFLCLVCLLLVRDRFAYGEAFADAKAVWDAGNQAYQSKEYERAADLFEQWIAEGRAAGVESPEANFNLGLAEWQAKRPQASVFHLMASAYLSTSPVRIWRIAQLLAEIEKAIGVKDGLPEERSFFLSLWINGNWLLTFALLSFWAWIAFAWLRWTQSGKYPTSEALFLSLGAGLAACVLVATPFSRIFSRYAVLNGDGKGAALFRTPEKSDDQLATLPAGTLVNFGKRENGFTQILRPFSGWVPDEQIGILTPDLESPPAMLTLWPLTLRSRLTTGDSARVL